MSELGAYLLTPAQAPAGTKGISNLLRSARWTYQILGQFLWWRAAQRLQQLEAQSHDVLAIWDELVLEKAESFALEQLSEEEGERLRRMLLVRGQSALETIHPPEQMLASLRSRYGLPSRADVQAPSDQIDALTKELDTLRQQAQPPES